MQLSVYADRTKPNTGGWQDRHDTAIDTPRGFETNVVRMLDGWQMYAVTHLARYDAKIGEDGVLGDHWEAIGDALRGLLNGECGRLDCGTLDGFILDTMKYNGIDVSSK